MAKDLQLPDVGGVDFVARCTDHDEPIEMVPRSSGGAKCPDCGKVAAFYTNLKNAFYPEDMEAEIDEVYDALGIGGDE